MKRITIISNTSWFVSNFFSSTLREFLKAGYKLSVIAPKDESSANLEALGCNFTHLELDRSGGNPLKEIRSIREMGKLLETTKPDCILSFTPKVNIYCAIAAYRLNIPIITTVSGLGTIFTAKGMKSFFGKALLKLTARLATHTIFQNTDDLDVYLTNRLVMQAHTSLIQGIGVDVQRFHYAALPNRHIFRFLLFSRLLYSKGVALYVDAAGVAKKRLAKVGVSADFAVMGFIDELHPDGIPEHQIRAWHKAGKINFLGSSAAVETIIPNFHCIVLPSHYREGMPQCLMEAASMGRPIITTDHTGCRDTIDHGTTGMLVKPKDQSELIEALCAMALLKEEEYQAMGLAARRKAERDFCHKTISSHYIRLIETHHL